MKFKINNQEWEIEEVNQDKFWIGNEERDGKMYYGRTIFYLHKILLDNSICKELKRTTLLHELMHCYIGSYITTQDDIVNYSEELLCDISANSHDIINKIVEDYFSRGKK